MYSKKIDPQAALDLVKKSRPFVEYVPLFVDDVDASLIHLAVQMSASCNNSSSSTMHGTRFRDGRKPSGCFIWTAQWGK
jgi:hypothetical protein